MRGAKQGFSPLSFRCNPARCSVDRCQEVSRHRTFFPRVWLGSIVGWRKLVKKKSTRDHKMFHTSCRKRLSVVLSAPTAITSHYDKFSSAQNFWTQKLFVFSNFLFYLHARSKQTT